MTLGELKKSLSRFPSDLDDCEMAFATLSDDGKEKYDLLAFTAYVRIKGYENPIFLLGAMEVALKMMKEGRLKDEDGNDPGNSSFNLNPE